MICLHNHDQILEFLRKMFLKGFQIYQNYLCALRDWDYYELITYFASFSFCCGGLVRWALSPILETPSLPTRLITSPVASSRFRRSTSERSTCSTRLEFCWQRISKGLVTGQGILQKKYIMYARAVQMECNQFQTYMGWGIRYTPPHHSFAFCLSILNNYQL